MNRPPANKRELVTGGSRGIGAAIVRRLAVEGAHVALTHVGNREAAENTARTARTFGVKVLAIRADSAEIASLVAWPAGPDAACVTGAGLSIDGGFSA